MLAGLCARPVCVRVLLVHRHVIASPRRDCASVKRVRWCVFCVGNRKMET